MVAFGPYAHSGSSVEAPAARYVQWKAVIHDGRPGDGIYWVSVAYLPRNLAPVIDGIALQDPGVRAQLTFVVSPGQQQNVSLKMPPSDNTNGVIITQSNPSPRFDQPPQGSVQKGYESVVWNAHDANDDELRYAVYFRGENEHEWKLLKDKLDQKFYSWDTTTMPDGGYYLKIVASDLPSNPPATALTVERESERFEVDNTPPLVEKLEAVVAGSAPMRETPPPASNARSTASTVATGFYALPLVTSAMRRKSITSSPSRTFAPANTPSPCALTTALRTSAAQKPSPSCPAQNFSYKSRNQLA